MFEAVPEMISAMWTLFYGMLPMSLLSIGGGITILPALHYFSTIENTWLNDSQFNASISIAQAAPGPNILFIAVIGWNVGISLGMQQLGAGGSSTYGLASASAFVALLGIILPSSILTFSIGRWLNSNSNLIGVRAFKTGFAPIVLALLISAGWILASGSSHHSVGLWLITGVTTLLAWRTKIHLLFLLAGGALCGALGWV